MNSTVNKSINSYSPECIKRLKKYYFQCFISEVSKIILFAFIFYKLNLFAEYIVALVIMMLLRSNGGGLHFSHYTSCLIVSFLMIFSSIFLATHFPVSEIITYIVLTICIIIGYLLVPITSTNRPAATLQVIKKSKRNTLVILSSILLVTCLVPKDRYIYICFWTVTLHICQLVLAKILERRKKHA